MKYAEHIADLVGNTPLVKLNSVTRGMTRATVLAKVEYLNPGGSVKDRIARRMVEDAEASGALQPGGTIVEPTSGNTGVGLALIAQRKGYHCIFVCPDKVSEDKRNVLKAYGAEVVVCPTSVAPEHPDSYYNVSDRLVRETPGAWKPNQYENPMGPLSHYESTGPEIWADTDGRVTHFVTGAGTGGTISGAGRYLREVSADRPESEGGRVQVVAADPEGSVYSGGTGRPYLVEGVGEDFWPGAYDPGQVDRVVAVSDAESFHMTRRLAREEGLLVGGSCGMAVVAALEVARDLHLDRATSTKGLPAVEVDPGGDESFDTTHFTVIDQAGNIVTNTYTLNGFYGSQVIPKGTGVLLNDIMAGFSANPDSRGAVAPGKRPVSSMTPMIALHPDGTPWFALGSPGSATIPNTVLQIVVNIIDYKMSLRDAIEYPRIHHQYSPDRVDAEPGALVADVADKLKAMGHTLNPRLRSQGDVHAVMVETGTKWRVGWSDGRRGGRAMGY